MKKFCIIIPFHNPERWHTDYTNQTARLLSKYHTVICFLWGDAVSIREIVIDRKQFNPITKKGNIWRYHPLFIIPGKRVTAVQYINIFLNLIIVYVFSSLISLHQKRPLIFWFFGIFDPVFLLLPKFFRYTKTVYDCVDAPSHPNNNIDRLLKQSESDLLSHAWIVTANSKSMKDRLVHARPDTHLVPLGFREEMFRHPHSYTFPPFGKRHVVGYIGAIDYRLNLPLLESLVRNHRTWQFILMGPVFHDHLSLRDQTRLHTLLSEQNVHHAHVPTTYIPSILSSCDVTIIPYRPDNDFNQYAFPMKTMEYLYAQKRIVASHEIQELHHYAPYVLFASHTKEWVERISYAIHHPLTKKERYEAKNIAMHHTWKQKVNAQLALMEGAES